MLTIGTRVIPRNREQNLIGNVMEIIDIKYEYRYMVKWDSIDKHLFNWSEESLELECFSAMVFLLVI